MFQGNRSKSYDEVRINDEKYAGISLTKLLGKPIIDIEVSVYRWDHDEPLLEIMQIVFEGGERLVCNGEHDVAYIEQSYESQILPSGEELVALYNAANAVEEGDEDYWEY